jgi:hypothetical protein
LQFSSQILLGLGKEARIAPFLCISGNLELFGFEHRIIEGFSGNPTGKGHI